MILDDLRIVFFHVGKAGGSTVERVLSSFSEHKDLIHHPSRSPLYGFTDDPDNFELRKNFMMGMLPNNYSCNGVGGGYLQHADVEMFILMWENKYDDYFKFTFVRNPFDRILSAYYYNGINKLKTFEEFIKNGDVEHRRDFNLNRHNYYSNNHFAPQHMHTHIDNKQYVDFIGKLENFNDDFQFILDKLGLKYESKFPILAKTKKSNIYNHYMDAYDSEMIDIIKKIYEIDFKLFNYS